MQTYTERKRCLNHGKWKTIMEKSWNFSFENWWEPCNNKFSGLLVDKLLHVQGWCHSAASRWFTTSFIALLGSVTSFLQLIGIKNVSKKYVLVQKYIYRKFLCSA